MELIVSTAALDELLPFSCLIDRKGVLRWMGRSLRKILNACGLAPEFQAWHQIFSVERPEVDERQPFSLEICLGQLLVLRLKTSSNLSVRFRGQLVALGANKEFWLLELTPSVSEVAQLSKLGLSYPDFPAGDPVFDFLMLLQSERRAFEKSEKARHRLVWENHFSSLLHQVAIFSAESVERDHAIATVMERVCVDLGWDFAHQWVVTDDGEHLRSSGRYYCPNRDEFRGFISATQAIELSKNEGLPGIVWAQGEMFWGDDFSEDAQFPRAKFLPTLKAWCGVGIPILVGGQVVSVLEFFSSRHQSEKPQLLRFFETLGTQLTSLVEKQAFLVREREQEGYLRASANLSSLGEMAAGISHEINNPLATISLGLTQMKGLAPPADSDVDAWKSKVLANVDRMERSVTRIQKIIKGMKALSRDGQGDPFVAYPLSQILEDTLSVCATRFKNSGIELRQQVDDFQLLCRPVQIGQILLNLLNNAVDAISGRTDPWVEVRAFSHEGFGVIEVSDCGGPIPDEVAKRLMTPFFTTKELGKGTGLGLSISRTIAAAHQGSFTLDRSRSTTTFVLKIPLAPALSCP
ncbi:MAG: hypothetical protein RJB38_617 [Pseudomonadota bacterium]|jgi:signal transduction histidine kinase